MADIFERIRQEVPIESWVEADVGSRAIKVGGLLRVNPCPFCSHNDCFTLYPKDNTWRCFSPGCDKGKNSSLIDYVMLRRGLSEPLEAAREIAEKMGIRADGKGPAAKPKGGKRSRGKKEQEVPKIPLKKALAVRRLAADFYHGELLLNTPEALRYQTEKRRHSIEALVAFKVGYASDQSLIQHATKAGFTVEDLMAIGLVKRSQHGYRAYIPKGAYVYPHMVNDKVLYFSIKHPDKWQIPKIHAAPGWYCMNQGALKAKRIIIVEGENDLLSVFDKGGYPHVIATLGNFNTSNLLSLLEKTARGKIYYLIFDNDVPDPRTGKRAGEEYIKKYCPAIERGGGKARIVRLKDVKDIDDFLRAAEDPKQALKDLMAEAGDPPPSPPDPAETRGAGDLYSFESFSVLGEMEDGRIVFQANDIQKIHIVNLRDLSIEKMIQIGGYEVRNRVSRNNQEMEDGQIHLYALRKHLVLEARKTQLGPLRWLGQGVSLLDDGRLLIVNGSEALIWNGEELEHYDKAMIEQKIISRRSSFRWIDTDALRLHLTGMNEEEAADIVFNETARLVEQWGFEGKNDSDLVTGFIFAQIVQSIWSWRPHLWITGPQGCGKTILLDLFKEIGGDLAKHFEGSSTSEAGFRQGIRNDFLLAAIDEFERSEEREKIIAYLRTAGRGGIIVKGSPGQEVMEYHLRHMVTVASIETGLVRAAEKTRFLCVELTKDGSRNPQLLRTHEMDELRVRIFAVAIWGALRCLKLIREMPRIQGFDPRLVEAYAVPLSMLSIVDEDPIKALNVYLHLCIEDHLSRDDEIQEDEESILESILNSTIRTAVEDDGGGTGTVYAERSILWLINSSNPMHHEDAASHGVWLLNDGSLFLATDLIRRKLLRDTPWYKHNITGFLRRIPGIKKDRVKRRRKLYKGLKYSDHNLLTSQLEIPFDE